MSEPPPTYQTVTIPGVAFDVPADDERRRKELMLRHCIALVQLLEADLGLEQTRPKRER
jgi:hypothetical protein